MKLYIRQKVFSWNSKFTVKDELGNDRYFIEGELFSLGKRLHITDEYGMERAVIQQKIFTLLPRFFVTIDGVRAAEIVKELTLFTPSYVVKGPGWAVEGSVFAHDYQILSGNVPIAEISKAWLSWGDSYAIDIARKDDELLALAVVLAIDCVLDQSNSTASFN